MFKDPVSDINQALSESHGLAFMDRYSSAWANWELASRDHRFSRICHPAFKENTWDEKDRWVLYAFNDIIGTHNSDNTVSPKEILND